MTTRPSYDSITNWLLLNHHKNCLMRLEKIDLQKEKEKEIMFDNRPRPRACPIFNKILKTRPLCIPIGSHAIFIDTLIN
jgi:hypothetical protein